MTDAQSLSEFRRSRSPEALRPLVRRHLGLVHGTALRIVGDLHLAEDITQATFIVLAKKASRLDPGTLPGWLVNTTRLAAKEALRGSRLRHRHESEAAKLRPESHLPTEEPTTDDLLPLLDDALAKLTDTDRTAVVLRFLQGQSFGQVGSAMDCTEEAARKRVGRAVEKLRGIFMTQGLAPSVGGLMVVLASQQSPQASAAAVAEVVEAISTHGTGASAATAKAVLSATTSAQIKLLARVVAMLLITCGLGLGIWRIGPARGQFTDRASVVQPEIADGTSRSPPSADSNALPDSIAIAQALKSQSSITNAAIDHFSLKVDKRANPTAPWMPTPESMQGSAWYNGVPGSMVRVQLTDIEVGVHNEWCEEQRDVGFDGTTVREAILRYGPLDNVRDVHRGSISPGPPRFLFSLDVDALLPYATGIAFSWNFFQTSDGRFCPIAQQLSQAANSSQNLDAQWDTVSGRKLVKITIPGTWYIWLDPSAGYALSRLVQELHLRQGVSLERELIIQQLVEAAHGIWFPTQAVCIMRDVGEGPDAQLRFTYHADAAIVNDPKFDPHIFTVPFPPRCFVYDAINNRRFTTDDNGATDDQVN